MTIFKLRILYKSGNSQEMWFEKFERTNDIWTFKGADDTIGPILLGVDNIEAVFQLEAKEIEK